MPRTMGTRAGHEVIDQVGERHEFGMYSIGVCGDGKFGMYGINLGILGSKGT